MNITKRTGPARSATRCSAPKMRSSSSSGVITVGLPPRAGPQTPFRYHPRPHGRPRHHLPRRQPRDTEGSPANPPPAPHGQVPGIVYGGGGVPAFAVDARILRNTLRAARGVIEVAIDGAAATP